MKVQVVGSGGREHALIWAISQSPSVEEIICAPGNPGIAQIATCFPFPPHEFADQIKLAIEKRVDLVVIGPEKPLVHGLANQMRKKGLTVFGPSMGAAIYTEGSKAKCKQLLRQANIPIPEFAIFYHPERAERYILEKWMPLVIKADGLCKGKGVFVCHELHDALRVVNNLMIEKSLGDAGKAIVVEKYLEGIECSVIAITDGQNKVILPPVRDYKRLCKGDKGPNTGGMGALAPVPDVTDEIMKRIETWIIDPTIRALAKNDYPFIGALYFGLMIVEDWPYVLELNCRFGDPETQATLPLLDFSQSDLAEFLLTTAQGKLSTAPPLFWTGQTAVCTVIASDGYAEARGPKTGQKIQGLDRFKNSSNIHIFHAATDINHNGEYVVRGGRVVGVTGLGTNPEIARRRSLAAAIGIDFEGAMFRDDIGL